jgi:hypothetical protein
MLIACLDFWCVTTSCSKAAGSLTYDDWTLRAEKVVEVVGCI